MTNMEWHAAGFEDGLNVAWECARKIISDVNHNGLSAEALCDIFGTHDLSHIMNSYTAKEAIYKIKSYESIDIGDEVIRNEKIGVVLIKDGDKDEVYVLTNDEIHVWNMDNIKKTGRHFVQATDLIRQIRIANVKLNPDFMALCEDESSSENPNKCFGGMTNGEVIQALFPYIKVETYEHTTSVKWLDCDKGAVDPYSYFWSKWWNAPYKVESGEQVC